MNLGDQSRFESLLQGGGGDDGLSRRGFLTGALASLGVGAFGGRVFAAPQNWSPAPAPDVVVGILSDTHLQAGGDGYTPHGGFPHTYVKNAMEYFAKCNIDAFMHLGDAAHRGKNSEIQYHVDIFEKFFPHGKSKIDGHTVHKLVVCGNHELYGDVVGGAGIGWAPHVWPDKAERDKHTLVGNLPKHWEKTWGEKYEPVWHKEVKGFHFFGRHWETPENALAEFILSKADELSLKGTKPFFVLSHKRLHFSCLNKLRAFPNAIGFCGHWHMSNADWKTIFFDNFGVTSFPTIQVGACRMDGGNCLDGKESEMAMRGDIVQERDDRDIDRAAWTECLHPSRQGLVMSIYDNLAVVFERREFGQGGSLGPKWVFPIGRFETKPYSRATLKKKIGSPEFAEGATLKLEKRVNVRVDGRDERKRTEDGIRILIPMADGNPKSRVYAYNVVVVGDDPKTRLFKSVYFVGANLGIGHEPYGGVTKLEILKSELPAGKELTIAVRPVSSLGTVGKAIAVQYRA